MTFLLFHKPNILYDENTKLPSDSPIWLQHQASNSCGFCNVSKMSVIHGYNTSVLWQNFHCGCILTGACNGKQWKFHAFMVTRCEVICAWSMPYCPPKEPFSPNKRQWFHNFCKGLSEYLS
jgi:hypothetical protein